MNCSPRWPGTGAGWSHIRGSKLRWPNSLVPGYCIRCCLDKGFVQGGESWGTFQEAIEEIMLVLGMLARRCLTVSVTRCTMASMMPGSTGSSSMCWTMVHTGSLNFYSRSFPGFLNNIQGVRFSRHSPISVPIILHIFHMKLNRMMLTGFVHIFGYCYKAFFSCHI